MYACVLCACICTYMCIHVYVYICVCMYVYVYCTLIAILCIIVFILCSALALLVDILTEPSQKDVINALTTLANVASHSASQFLVSTVLCYHNIINNCPYVQLGQLKISDKIKILAQSGPSARYQVTRLLVYTGEIRDNHCDGNLFANNDCGMDFFAVICDMY